MNSEFKIIFERLKKLPDIAINMYKTFDDYSFHEYKKFEDSGIITELLIKNNLNKCLDLINNLSLNSEQLNAVKEYIVEQFEISKLTRKYGEFSEFELKLIGKYIGGEENIEINYDCDICNPMKRAKLSKGDSVWICNDCIMRGTIE